MAASSHEMPSRKPSGSSTRSSTHSPLSSPGNPYSHHRKLTPQSSGNMLAVGMSPASSLKGLNPGWAWTNTGKRTASSSSVASVPDMASSQGDSGYRSLSDGWHSSAAWDDVSTSPQRRDSIQYDTLPRNNARQRQVNASASTAAMSRVPSSVVDADLTLGFRGMDVEDDHAGALQAQSPYHQPIASAATPTRAPKPAAPPLAGHPPRGTYSNFGQNNFAAYPNAPPPVGRDGYVDYSYPYDAYRNPSDTSMYPPPSAFGGAGGGFPSSGGFFDYTGSVRPLPASQFYYPAQPMLAPLPLMEYLGSNDTPFTVKQHPSIPSRGMAYPAMRPSSSAHRAYAAAVDYSPRLSVVVPGGIMFPSLSSQGAAMHRFPHGPSERRSGRDRDATLRSPMLEDFRVNRARKWELKDVYGYVVEFSEDQHGSRFIQQRLESASTDDKQMVFNEIVPNNVLPLVQDVFGNYVVQKLFEHGTQVQKVLLANAMENHVLSLSLQMYGCRVIQRAIEHILPDQQSAFVKELEPQIMRCVKDANGNHVVQKLIERVAPERLTFVTAFQGNVYELATHPYGCRVLQRCLEHLTPEQTRPLLDEMHKYATNLMQDQFGNYVIQFLLEHGAPQDRTMVISKLHGQMLHMARHKFASNVCEKALMTADAESRCQLIDEIMVSQHDGVSPIVMMMKDQFANYVLQRAMLVAEGQQQQDLANKVRPQLATMRRYASAYSKHLISIERALAKCSPPKSQDA